MSVHRKDILSRNSSRVRRLQFARIVLHDRITMVLLVLVLLTNFVIFFSPALADAFDAAVAKYFSLSVHALQVPVYVLLGILITRRISYLYAHGGNPSDRNPSSQYVLLAVQCLLLASLLCGTFLMHKQFGFLKTQDPATPKSEEQVLLEKPGQDAHPRWMKMLTL